jgi:methionine-rich copper-binding protein CopC
MTFIGQDKPLINGKISKFILFLGLLIFGSIIFSGTVSAASYNVGPGSNYTYHNISSALAVAKNGDTVKVYPNTNGSSYSDSISINNKINLTAVGPVNIKPSTNSSTAFIYLLSGSNGSIIQGFNIINNGKIGVGIEIYASKCTIINNNITNFSYGIYTMSSALNNTIIQNKINTTPNSNGNSVGIWIDSSGNQISHNTITANITGKGVVSGIELHQNNNNININNIYINCPGTVGSSGIFLDNSSYNNITTNYISEKGNSTNINNYAIHIQDNSNINKIFENNINSIGGGLIFSGNAESGNKVNFNRIIASNSVICNYNLGLVDARYNWYGNNTPSANKFIGNVTYAPWLVLKLNATPTTIKEGGNSTITANLLYDSNGAYHNPTNGYIMNGIPITFKTTVGTINSPVKLSNGVAKATLNGSNWGNATISAILDNQTIKTPVTINQTIPPKINSSDPKNGAVNVSTNKVITVTFSESVTNLKKNYIEIKGSNGTTILFNTNINSNGNILTITPTTTLAKGVKYTIFFHTGCVTDLAGNPLAPTSFTFTTTN